jgi:hypothetical protein
VTLGKKIYCLATIAGITQRNAREHGGGRPKV